MNRSALLHRKRSPCSAAGELRKIGNLVVGEVAAFLQDYGGGRITKGKAGARRPAFYFDAAAVVGKLVVVAAVQCIGRRTAAEDDGHVRRRLDGLHGGEAEERAFLDDDGSREGLPSHRTQIESRAFLHHDLSRSGDGAVFDLDAVAVGSVAVELHDLRDAAGSKLKRRLLSAHFGSGLEGDVCVWRND